MKGGESCPDNVRDIPPVRSCKYGPEVVNATSGAPEGERADRKARGAARCHLLPSAFWRSAPSRE